MFCSSSSFYLLNDACEYIFLATVINTDLVWNKKTLTRKISKYTSTNYSWYYHLWSWQSAKSSGFSRTLTGHANYGLTERITLRTKGCLPFSHKIQKLWLKVKQTLIFWKISSEERSYFYTLGRKRRKFLYHLLNFPVSSLSLAY